ncbi:MAG: T9SS type A sorting domain-containing protein [Sphingobacteriales bacterium]|nr:T9SS type A sorting domain-containing protein [Sphingobacteriales bacterium]
MKTSITILLFLFIGLLPVNLKAQITNGEVNYELLVDEVRQLCDNDFFTGDDNTVTVQSSSLYGVANGGTQTWPTTCFHWGGDAPSTLSVGGTKIHTVIGANSWASYFYIDFDSWENDTGDNCTYDGSDDDCRLYIHGITHTFKDYYRTPCRFWDSSGSDGTADYESFFIGGQTYTANYAPKTIWRYTHGTNCSDALDFGTIAIGGYKSHDNSNRIAPGAPFLNPIDPFGPPLFYIYLCTPEMGYNSVAGNNSPDVFYKFTLASAAQVTVSTNDSYTNYNTLLRLYNSTDCATPIATNDDAPGTNKSSITTYLCAGTYTVLVEGSSTIFDAGDFRLSVQATNPPPITTSGPTTFCAGGSVNLTAGTAGVLDTYQWNNTAGDATSITVTATSGDYVVTVTGAGGCTRTAIQTVNLFAPSMTASGSTSICDGSAITLTATPGSTYQWSTPTGSANTQAVTAANAGTYVVTVTNAAGCTGTDAKTITIIPASVINFSGLNANYCANSSAAVTLTGNQAPKGTFTGPGITDLGNGTAIFNPANAGSGGQISYTSSTNAKWLSISAGDSHSLGIKTDGTLWAWGRNNNGQLGDGTLTQRNTPVKIGNANNWLSVSAGSTHSLALKVDGTLWAWGRNVEGQLGDGTYTNRNVPTQIGTATWLSVSAGALHSLAIRSNGSLWAWGRNGDGQLGDGTTTTKNAPTQSGTESNWVSISAGSYHNLGIRTDKTLWAWGRNNFGQLGNGTNLNRYLPTRISTTAWQSVSAGGGHSLAIKPDGTLWTWGQNDFGQLGDATNNNRNTPAQIGSSTWQSSSGGASHTIAIKTDGTLWTWGRNEEGQLGDGSFTNRNSPLQIDSGTNWQIVSAGTFHSLAVKPFGDLWTCGWNIYGQVGDGTVVNKNALVSTITNGGNGCTATYTQAVSVNAIPNIAITNNSPVCAGNAASLMATGGSAYIWSNGNATSTATTTAAGTYTVTVTNANACTNTASTSVSLNELPAATINGERNICNGNSTTLTATGGVNYAWSNGSNTPNALISTAGAYTVTVTNAAGCTKTATTSITVNPLPTASISGGGVTICAGGNTPLTATGGTYYSWSNGDNTPTATVTLSTNTTYTVTITDDNGCQATANTTVSVDAPTIVINGPTSICTGTTNTLTATGGVAYAWSNASTTASTTIVAAGTYTVTVTNAAGCTKTATRTITVLPLPTASISGATSVCAGNSTTFTATGNGTYAWSNGATTASTTISTGGTYTVTVTNANGCIRTATRTLTVNALPAASISGATSICTGFNTILTATGGSAYAWNNGSNTAAITASTAGTYTVTVTNTAGCTKTATTTVTVNALPTASISGNSPICLGSSTTLTATGGGTYAWSNGSTTANISTPPLSANTTFTVTVTNAAGCTKIATQTVGINPLPTATLNSPTAICMGSTANLIAAGGATYAWSNGSTTANATTAPLTTPTTFTVTVTGANGCTQTAVAPININALPTATITGSGPICPNTPIVLTATGGTSYNWSNASPIANTTINAPGTYTVTVTNANACTRTATTVIATGTAAASIGNTTPICVGNATSLTAFGGGNYVWNNGATTPIITTTPLNATTTYTVTVTNTAGCTGTAATTVVVNANPTISISNIVNAICNTGGSMKVNASGAAAPYTPLWSNGATTATINNLNAATYIVTVTASTGCTTTAAATISNLLLGTPTGLNTTNITATTATFNWNAVAGAANYTIFGRKVGTTIWVSIGPIIGTSKNISSQLVACKNYEWLVQANCADGVTSGGYSAISTFSTAGCKTDEDLDTNAPTQIFSLLPNPANSWITLNYIAQTNSSINIKLFDVVGKEMLRQTTAVSEGDNSIDININQLPQGYYVVEVNDGTTKLHQKLLIAR